MSLEPYEGQMPQVAESAFVHDSAVLIGAVQVGENATVWPNVTLRGDDGAIVIGENTSVQDGAVVHSTEGLSEVSIGPRVTVGHNAIIHGATIGADCIIGMGAIILDNAEIGEGCLVGAGALVTQRSVIPPGSLVLGSPAKVVRPLKEEERGWIEYSWRHYVRLAERYKKG